MFCLFIKVDAFCQIISACAKTQGQNSLFHSSSFSNISFLSNFRCLAICKPLSSYQWRTVKRAKALIFTIYILAVFYVSLYTYTTNYRGPRVCVSVGKDDEITRYLSWFMLVVNSIFPFISILVMNVMILRAIHKRPNTKFDFNQNSKSETSMSVDDTGTSDSVKGQCGIEYISQETNIRDTNLTSVPEDNKIRMATAKRRMCANEFDKSSLSFSVKGKRRGDGGQLAVMLLCVSFAFLALTLPLSVRSVVYALGFFSADSNRENAQTALVVSITSRLMLLNGAINFWLYSIAGRKFRQDLKKVLFKR